MAWLSGWTYRQKVTIGSGAVSADLTDFPVYIDLATMNSPFFSNVQSDGSDIRVTSSDGETVLEIDLVYIDTGSSKGELHFKAPSVLTGSDNDFYIYYGKTGESVPAGTGVWSDYLCVYHFHEDPGGGVLTDSSPNGYDGTVDVAPAATGTVAIDGSGWNFPNDDSRANITGISSTNQTYSFSFWTSVTSGSLADRGVFDSQSGRLIILSSNTSAALRIYDGGYRAGALNSRIDNWAHVYLIANATAPATSGFTNGSFTESGAYTARNIGGTTKLGGFYSTSGDYAGALDEFKIYEGIRTVDWIAAEYSNQNAPGSFYTVAAEEELASGALTPSGSPIDFGVHYLGDPYVDIEVALENTSGAETTGWLSIGPYVDFEVISPPTGVASYMTIPAGEASGVVIRFTPTEVGIRDVIIRTNSDDYENIIGQAIVLPTSYVHEYGAIDYSTNVVGDTVSAMDRIKENATYLITGIRADDIAPTEYPVNEAGTTISDYYGLRDSGAVWTDGSNYAPGLYFLPSRSADNSNVVQVSAMQYAIDNSLVDVPVWDTPATTGTPAGIPGTGDEIEHAFLHFAVDTMYVIDGVTGVTPGWPDGSAPTPSAARIHTWNATHASPVDNPRYALNHSTEAARALLTKGAELVNLLTPIGSGTSNLYYADGIFLDNGGLGMSGQGIIISGGVVLEAPTGLPALGEDDQTNYWDQANWSGSLNEWFFDNEITWLQEFRTHVSNSPDWHPDGKKKIVVLNFSNQHLPPELYQSQVADIILTESRYNPVEYAMINPSTYAPSDGYQFPYEFVQAAEATGVALWTMPGLYKATVVSTYSGESSEFYTIDESFINSFGAHLMIMGKRTATSSLGGGTSYYGWNNEWGLGYIPGSQGTEGDYYNDVMYSPVMELTHQYLGDPTGAPYIYNAGTDPQAEPYEVWAREFENGIVLSRLIGRFDEYTDERTAVTVDMSGGTYYRPLVDRIGNFGALSDSFDFRNGRSYILLEVPPPTSYTVSFELSDLPPVLLEASGTITRVEPTVSAILASGGNAYIEYGIYYDGTKYPATPAASSLLGSWQYFDNDGETVYGPGGAMWTAAQLNDAEGYVTVYIEPLTQEQTIVNLSMYNLEVDWTTELIATDTAVATGTIQAIDASSFIHPIERAADPTGITLSSLAATTTQGAVAATIAEPTSILLTAMDANVAAASSTPDITITGLDATTVQGEVAIPQTGLPDIVLTALEATAAISASQDGDFSVLTLTALDADTSEGFFRTADIASIVPSSLAATTSGELTRSAESPPSIILTGIDASSTHVPVQFAAADYSVITLTAIEAAADAPLSQVNASAPDDLQIIAMGAFRTTSDPATEAPTLTSPIGGGIDTDSERSFFNNSPVIGRDIDQVKITTGEIGIVSDLTDLEDHEELPAEDERFLQQLETMDSRLEQAYALLDDVQGGMLVTVDPATRPDVVEAIGFFLDKDSLTRGYSSDRNTVDFTIYKRAYDIWRRGTVRGLGENFQSEKEAKEYAQRIKKHDSDKSMSLTSRVILAIVLDFLASNIKIPGVGGRLRKWAKKLAEIAPYELALGISVTDEGETTSLGEGDILGGLLSGPPENVISIDGLAYAATVVDYVHMQAQAGEIRDVSPGSFYFRPMVDVMHEHHLVNRAFADLSLSGDVRYLNRGPLKPVDSAKEAILTHLDDIKELADEVKKVGGIPTRSETYKSIRDYGAEKSIQALDSMMWTMRQWYRDADTLCCLIKMLGGMGKLDMKFLKTMRAILRWKIERELTLTVNLFDGIGDMLNTLLRSLTGKLLGVVQTMLTGPFDLLYRTLKELRASEELAACTPLDDLVGTLIGELYYTQREIGAMLISYMSGLTATDTSMRRLTFSLERKQRLEMYYRIVDAIIRALENGELCRETRTYEPEKPPYPSIDEIGDFLKNYRLDGFDDAYRSRRYVIDRYGRDPVTGRKVDDIIYNSQEYGSNAFITRSLENCPNALDASLGRIKKIMGDWNEYNRT